MGPSCGILYYVWGDYDSEDLLRSSESAKRHGVDFEVVEVPNDKDGYMNRCGIYGATPFDLTLHLDTDTVVLGDLSYGFEMADQHQIALCIAPAFSAWEAANRANTPKVRSLLHKDSPQYNCGVIFYRKGSEIIKLWCDLIGEHLEAAENDQPFLSVAMREKSFSPYVLPFSWNFRPHLKLTPEIIYGEVKILHSRSAKYIEEYSRG